MSAGLSAAALPGYHRPAAWEGLPLVDADVRIAPPPLSDLFPYLDAHWRDYAVESGLNALGAALHPVGVPGVFRPGTTPAAGAPGSDPTLLRIQLLDPWQVDAAVSSCALGVDALHNDDLAAVLASAVNRWQSEHWLTADARLRGSAVVPVQNVELAVAEVERIAADRSFVQVLLPVRSREPLGRRSLLPILRAAAEADLAVALHPSGSSGLPTTPVGWATSYTEEYVDLALAFQAQILSLVAEGAFAALPALRVVCIESGLTWLPPLLWRFDKNWKGLRREVPWVHEPPSEIVRRHVRLTAPPLDAAAGDPFLRETLDQLESEEMVLFGSGYPLAHFPSEDPPLPPGMTRSTLARVLAGNARDTYRLGAPGPMKGAAAP